MNIFEEVTIKKLGQIEPFDMLIRKCSKDVHDGVSIYIKREL
jgi:hypothetical protein